MLDMISHDEAMINRSANKKRPCCMIASVDSTDSDNSSDDDGIKTRKAKICKLQQEVAAMEDNSTHKHNDKELPTNSQSGKIRVAIRQ